jgi:hypothetical protein
MKAKHTEWYPEKSLVVSRLSGNVDKADISEWEKSLLDTLNGMEDHTSFKIFVDLHGFQAADLDAHKRFRGIVPLTLAQYDWKVGYVDLFEEAKTLAFSATRGIRCVGAAHCHQDATKIELYEARFSRAGEHFFTDRQKALDWITEYEN